MCLSGCADGRSSAWYRRYPTWRLGLTLPSAQASEDADPAEEDAAHNSGPALSSDDESKFQTNSGSSHKEQDKEWAALTTWLRMNLHQVLLVPPPPPPPPLPSSALHERVKGMGASLTGLCVSSAAKDKQA